MHSYAAQLRLIRRFTGDAFSPAHGYSASKKPNFGQRMAVLRYFEKVQELTATGYGVYTPKYGEKTEAFNYTGQKGWRKFKKAIIRQPSPEAKLSFKVDRKRPRGTRFVVTDRNTGRNYYNVPAHLFDYGGDDPEEEQAHYEDVLDHYAADAQFFLINAGNTYIWGAGGNRESISKKVADLRRNYDAHNFDPTDKNSSYIGNWFGGVTGFTSRFDILPQVGEALQKSREYKAKYKMSQTKKYRELRNGLLGVFENGRLTETIVQTWKRK